MSDNNQILNNVKSLTTPRHDGGVTHNDSNIIDLEFSVQVEVETCDGDGMNQGGVSIDHPIPDSRRKEEYDSNVIQIDEEHPEDDKSNGVEKVFYIRKVLPQSTSKTDSTTLVTQYAITMDTIKKAIQAQSKENDNAVDKYLDVAIRNFHGQFDNISLSYYDEQVNKVLRFWKDWYAIFRETPLLYKCYLCCKGWWRLYPFKEHLKMHQNPDLKLSTETNHHEFFVIARSNRAPKVRDVIIESNCPKCGRDSTFHRHTDQALKYECEGCKKRTVTCSKLKEHEIICMEYLKVNCERYNVDKKDGTMCQVCIMFCPTQELLDSHMIECHLVRSDEPVALDTKICKVCSGRYFNNKYHDCPCKNKSFKCNYCCRKFIVVSLRNIHMHFSKRSSKCMVCNKLMVECLAMEHYVQHSSNYSLLYYCCKCENKVLYSNVKFYNDHMRHHNSTMARRRWGGRMLLPTKCLNGDIVKSETLLKIPDEKLANFMCGLEGSEGATTGGAQSLASRTADDDDVIILNAGGLDAPASTAAGEPEKVADQDRELWAMQAQLDAEIQKDIEIEAAISKVFSASNTYLKFMAKEKEKELMEEEELYDDDLIIIDRAAEEVTVISDSESEGEAGTNSPEVPKTVPVNDGGKQSDGQSDADDLDLDVKNDIHLPPEEEIYVSSDTEDADWNVATVKHEADVKTEMEDEEMATDSFSLDDVKHEEMQDLTAEGYEEMLRIMEKTKKEIDSDAEAADATERAKGTIEGSADVYRCKKCVYEGPWGQYVAHVASSCPGTVFSCGRCGREFGDLRFYLDHLVEHGFDLLTCPECKESQEQPRRLYSHVIAHIRALFRAGEAGYPAQCRNCSNRVEPERFFEHWQMNLNGGCRDLEGTDSEREVDGSVRTSTDSDEEERLKPEVISEILDLLRIHDKRMILQCTVCRKRFGRRNECKRHLIEHLLVESMLNRAATNHRLRCYFCPEEFLVTLEWKQHMREHSFLPAFKCDICEKCFSDSSNYSKHRKVHNLFSFICDLCGGKFNAKRTLQNHLKMHEKNTLVCEYCHMTFISESRLKKHKIGKHYTIPSSYPCSICRKRFISLREKWDHMWLKHKYRNVCADCPLCKKSYRRFRDVATHMKTVHKVSYSNKE